jgi:hypothetical protein
MKSFLESNLPVGRLDRTGMTQGTQSITMCLNSYIRNHELPVKILTRKGEIYLLRTDIDEQGNFIDPKEATEEEPPLLDESEVEARFEQEKNLTAK